MQISTTKILGKFKHSFREFEILKMTVKQVIKTNPQYQMLVDKWQTSRFKKDH